MEREAGLARDPNKKLAHDKRRAQQKARRGMVLPIKREDGTPDPTPHIASLDMLTGGRYLRLGRGYVVKK